MKQLIFTIALILSFLSSVSQVGIGTDIVEPNAILQIESTNQGLLLPQISLTSSTDVITITNPEESLLVFNTNTLNDVYPGYYYWDGAAWARFTTDEKPSIKYINTSTQNVNANTNLNLFGAIQWNSDTSYYEVLNVSNLKIKRPGVYNFDINVHFDGDERELVSPQAQIEINGVPAGPIAASAALENKDGEGGKPGGNLIITTTLTIEANDEITVAVKQGTSLNYQKRMVKINNLGTSYIYIKCVK